MDRVNEACKIAVELEEMKQKILTYVQSRMTFIAPNLTVIVGASTAAKLMGTMCCFSELTDADSS